MMWSRLTRAWGVRALPTRTDRRAPFLCFELLEDRSVPAATAAAVVAANGTDAPAPLPDAPFTTTAAVTSTQSISALGAPGTAAAGVSGASQTSATALLPGITFSAISLSVLGSADDTSAVGASETAPTGGFFSSVPLSGTGLPGSGSGGVTGNSSGLSSGTSFNSGPDGGTSVGPTSGNGIPTGTPAGATNNTTTGPAGTLSTPGTSLTNMVFF